VKLAAKGVGEDAQTYVEDLLVQVRAQLCLAACLAACSAATAGCAALRSPVLPARTACCVVPQEHQRYHEVLVAGENKRKALLDIVYALEVRCLLTRGLLRC
jgi:hypothetical protein